MALMVPTSLPAQAAVPPVSARTGSVVTADGLPTVQINGVVWTQLVVGDRVFAAGEFSRARPAGAAPGTQERTRWNLLSYNLHTGTLNTFAPQFNGPIRALAVSDTGKSLYVGGSSPRSGPTRETGSPPFGSRTGSCWTVGPASTTPSSHHSGQQHGVSRAARSPRSVERQRSAGWPRSRPSGGTVLSGWAPKADEAVRALADTPETRTRSSSGGRLLPVNGHKVSDGMAVVDAKSGVVAAGRSTRWSRDYGPRRAIISLAADKTTVYGSGYAFGRATSRARSRPPRATARSSGCRTAMVTRTSVAPIGGVVYAVGHAHYCSNIGGFPDHPAGSAIEPWR